MPKKKPSTDGRKNRYIPLALTEFEHADQAIKTLSGYFAGICAEMRSQNLESLPIDGRRTLEESLAGLLAVARKAQGSLEASKMNLG